MLAPRAMVTVARKRQRTVAGIAEPEARGAAALDDQCGSICDLMDRWDALVERGARVQRPLWASTSTKNPDYPDTLYVDELIGPDVTFQVPRHIFITPGGEVLMHRTYYLSERDLIRMVVRALRHVRPGRATELAIDAIAEAGGGIHTLVYAAGPHVPQKHLSTVTPAEMHEQLETDAAGLDLLFHLESAVYQFGIPDLDP